MLGGEGEDDINELLARMESEQSGIVQVEEPSTPGLILPGLQPSFRESLGPAVATGGVDPNIVFLMNAQAEQNRRMGELMAKLVTKDGEKEKASNKRKRESVSYHPEEIIHIMEDLRI